MISDKILDETKELDWIPEIGETKKITYLVFFSHEFSLMTNAAGVPGIYYIDVVNYGKMHIANKRLICNYKGGEVFLPSLLRRNLT